MSKNDTLLIMNTNDEDLDLGLSLGSTSHPIPSRMNSSSGAGVNANFRGDMAFAASDPLSELVWLPHKGLSLKCADSSLEDKKPFLLWNVGQSNKVLSPSQIIRSWEPEDDRVINVGRSSVPQTFQNVDGKIDDKVTPASPLRSSPMLDANCGHYEGTNGIMEGGGFTDANQEDEDLKENRGNFCSPHIVEIVDSVEGSPTPAGAPPMVKLECTAENDLFHPAAKDKDTQCEERLQRCNSLSVEISPTNSRIQMYLEKGKEKALSDGDDNGRSTDDEEDSHKSAESCNSAGLFSKGIKRLKCNQELIVDSKRMKIQNQGTRISTSNVNHDSSFMNWIANMVKGVQDFNKEVSPSVAFTLANSNGFDHQETIPFDKIHDSKSQNIGFQAMFQSLYCSNTKIPETGFLNENNSMGESKDCMVAEETFLENCPKSCPVDKDSSFRQISLSNEEVNLPISRNIVDLSSEPWILSVDFDCETNKEGNKASNDLAIERGKNGISSSNALCKLVDSNEENTSLNFPLEGKATGSLPHQSSPLASLWITRLSVKTPELENCNWSTDQVLDCSPDSVRVNLNTQVDAAFLINQECSEMKNFAANCETSVSNKSINKLNPILPPQKFESSEAMASVFARRLDALRHITPSDMTKPSTCTSKMCYFCGKIGHELRECSDVTEIEMKDLASKISLFDRVEESGCLCIRCSQLNHWANACPLASSSGHCPSKESTSFVNYSSHHLMFCSGNENYSSYLGREEENSQLAIDQRAHSFRKLRPDFTPSNLTWDSNEFLGKRIYEVKKRIASNPENNIKEDQSFPLCKVLSSQNDALVEMFHAIRKLRLSRADILRWMNSPISQWQLNGFFLRLRLGKWTIRLNKEESQPAELGGSGYYIACITGAQRDNLDNSSKNSIFVDVEGIKYSVESRYISNHDFLEDEIKMWWCRIVKTGGKIPSINELNSKLRERKILGF